MNMSLLLRIKNRPLSFVFTFYILVYGFVAVCSVCGLVCLRMEEAFCCQSKRLCGGKCPCVADYSFCELVCLRMENHYAVPSKHLKDRLRESVSMCVRHILF